KKYFLFKNLDKIQFIVNSRDPMLIFMIYSKKIRSHFCIFLSNIILLIFAFYITGTPIPKAPSREHTSFLNVLLDSYLLSQRFLKVSFLE
ncbi:hypothetical protein cje110_04506, partial [Campylobacter jejuni subsp. jejuni LMG 23264]